MGARRDGGFTLVEAMVVIAIVGILAAVAAPNLTGAIGTMRAKNAAFDLISDLSLARSEALKRNQTVTVRPVAAADWTQGWCVTTNAADACTDSAATTLLLRKGTLGSSLSVSSASTTVAFQPNGRASADTATGNLSWSISSTVTGVGPRCVVITPTGSARSKTGTCS